MKFRLYFGVKEMLKKDQITRMLFKAGVLLLIFIVSNALVATIFYLFNLPIMKLTFWLALVITLVLYFVLFKRKGSLKQQLTTRGGVILAFGLILVSSILVGGKIYDVSYDGNYYHKTAIGLLKNGWNPLTESSEQFSEELLNLSNNKIHKWVNHYQNISWLFGASVYKLTDNIESAKAINFIIVAAVLFISVYLLQKIGIKTGTAVLVSLAVVASPIMMAQIFTFYIDGILGLIFYLYVMLLCLLTKRWFKENKIDNEDLLLIGVVMAIMINLKLTGLALAGIFAIPFGIAWLVKYIKDQKRRGYFLRIVFSFLAFVAMSVCLIGATTYVKNQFVKGNAFYPLLGADKADIITTMQPRNFSDKSQAEKILISIFSESNNLLFSSAEQPYVKDLLSFNRNEINNLRYPDTRIGGFGVFYGVIFLITLIMLVVEIVILMKNKVQNSLALQITICVVSGCVLYAILPTENWWARYAPNIYLLTLLALVLAAKIILSTRSNTVKYALISVASAMAVLLFLNAGIFFENRLNDFRYNKTIKKQLLTMQEEFSMKSSAIKIRSSFAGVVFNLIDLKIIHFGKNDLQILGDLASEEQISRYKHRAYYDMLIY